MTSVGRAAFVAATAFGCAMVGLLLQKLVPAAVVTDGRAAVGSIIGVLALLIALVLGLLIWTSYGVFATQQSEAQTLGLSTLQLDYLLEQYGPEADEGRINIRGSAERSRARFFGSKRPDTEISFALARERMHSIDAFFASLHPTEEDKKQLLAAAKPLATSIVATQVLMSRQLVNPVPELLIYMVQIWSALLFLGFGVMGSVSIFSVVADAAGAFAISSAIFLIIEFSAPYSGLFRISSANMDKVIAELKANGPK